MAAKAELKAVLKLDNLQFVRNIRQSIQLVKGMAVQFAKAPIKTTFVAGILTARKAVQTTASAIRGMADIGLSAMKKVGVGAAIIAGTLLLISKYSIGAASEMEQYTRSFSVLLGGMDKGAQRMKELLKFSNDKGLQLTNVADASQTLQTLTRGALATGKGLKFVGDVASGTRVPLGEMAVTLGRLYDAMSTGQSGSGELARLQEIGALSGIARKKIEALGSSGFGAQGWKEVQKELSKYNGMLDVMSTTWERRMERFHDSIQEVGRQFGAPLIESLGPSLKLASDYIFSLDHKVNEMGKNFGSVLESGIKFGLGVLSNPSLILDPFIHTLKAGFLAAGNVFIYTLQLGTAMIPTFLSTLTNGFLASSKIMGGTLMGVFQKPIAYLIAGMEKARDMAADAKGGNALTGLEVLQYKHAKSQVKSWEDKGQKATNREDTREAMNQIREWTKVAKGFEDRLAGNKGNESIESRFNKIMADGAVGGLATSTVAEGKEELKNVVESFFDKLVVAVNSVSLTDSMGAEGELQKARDAALKAIKAGNKVSDSIKPPTYNDGKGAAAPNSFVFSNTRGRLSSGSIGIANNQFSSGSLNDQARRTTSLLSFRERREFDIQRRAGVQGVLGGREQGDTLVRRGDRQRRQEYQREKLREKSGLEKTNAILEKIQIAFDAFTK